MSGSWPDLDGRRRSLGQAPPPPSAFYQPPQPFNPAASLLPMPPARYASSGNSELSQPASPFATAAAQQHPAAPQPTGGGILSPRSRLAPPPTALPVFSQPLGSLRPSAGQGSDPEPARPPRRLDLEAAGSVAPLVEESSTSLTPDIQSQLRGQTAYRFSLPTPPSSVQQQAGWPQAGAAPAPVVQPWPAPALPQAQAAAQQVPAPAAPASYGVSSRQESMASIGSTPTMPPAGLPPPPALHQAQQPAAWGGQHPAQPEEHQAWGEQPPSQQEAPAWGDHQYQYQAQAQAQEEEQAWARYQAEESAAGWPAIEAPGEFEAASPDLPPPPGTGNSPIKAFYYKWAQPGSRPGPAPGGHATYAPPAAKQAVPELDAADGSSYPHFPGGSDYYGTGGAQPPAKDAESWGLPPPPPASAAHQAPGSAVMSPLEPATAAYGSMPSQPAVPHAFMPGQAADAAPAPGGAEPTSAGFAAPPGLHGFGPPGGAQPAGPAFFQAGTAQPQPGGFMPQSAGFGGRAPPAQTFGGTSVFTPRAPEASGQGAAAAAGLPSGTATQPARKQRRRRSICGRLMPLLLLCGLICAAFGGAGTVVAITAAGSAVEATAATLASFPWRAVLSSSEEPVIPSAGALAGWEPALHAAVLRVRGANLWAEGQAARVARCEPGGGKACRSVQWTAHKMCLGAALSKELALAAAAAARSAPGAAAQTWERLRQPGALDPVRAQAALGRETAVMLGNAGGRAALWAQAKQRLATSKAAAADGGRWLRCSMQHLQTTSDWSARGVSNGVAVCWAEHMGRYYLNIQQYHEQPEQPPVVEAPEHQAPTQAAAEPPAEPPAAEIPAADSAAAEPPAEPAAADAAPAPAERAHPEAAAAGAGLGAASPAEAAAGAAAVAAEEVDDDVVEEPLPAAEEGGGAPSTPEPPQPANATAGAGEGSAPGASANATAAELQPASTGATDTSAAMAEQAPEQPPAPANVTASTAAEPAAAAAADLVAAAAAPAAAKPPVGSEAIGATGQVPPEPEVAMTPPEAAAVNVADAGVQAADATLASPPAPEPAAPDSTPAAAEAPPPQPEDPVLPVQRQQRQTDPPAHPTLAEEGAAPKVAESQAEAAQLPAAAEPATPVLPAAPAAEPAAEPAPIDPYEDDAAYFGLPPPVPRPAEPEAQAQQPAEPAAPSPAMEAATPGAAPEAPEAQPEAAPPAAVPEAAPEPPAVPVAVPVTPPPPEQQPEELAAEAPRGAPEPPAAQEQPAAPAASSGPPLRERAAAALGAARQAVVEHQAVIALLGTALAAVAATAAAVSLTVFKARQAQLLPMTPLLSPNDQLPRSAKDSSRRGRPQLPVAEEEEEEEEEAGAASDSEEAAPSVSRSLLASLLGTKAKADAGEEVEQAAPSTSKRGRRRKSTAALAPVTEAEEGPAPATSSRRRKAAAAPAVEGEEGADAQPLKATSRPSGRGKSEAGGSKTPRASALTVSVQTTKTTVTRRARGKPDATAE